MTTTQLGLNTALFMLQVLCLAMGIYLATKHLTRTRAARQQTTPTTHQQHRTHTFNTRNTAFLLLTISVLLGTITLALNCLITP